MKTCPRCGMHEVTCKALGTYVQADDAWRAAVAILQKLPAGSERFSEAWEACEKTNAACVQAWNAYKRTS
jgi:redox-regulated HSP33 family molecular chaperone